VFLRAVVSERNQGRTGKVAEELAVMRPLPTRPLATCRELVVTVSRSSTIRVVGKTYSVPSRLIGHRIGVRLYATQLELEYQGRVIECIERIQGHGAYRVDYRHVIHSLVRKPGAFRRYVFQEALFPSVTFRRCYDELVARSTGWADLEYVRILGLAATRQETEVEACLVALLSEGVVPEYETVKARIEPAPTPLCPEVQLLLPDLRVYDALLESQGVAL
jgi:Mu transposase-like protein